jgi:hypothetical protein
MNILDQAGGESVGRTQLLPQATVVGEIQSAVRNGYGRLLVLGPPGSRRLASTKRALRAMGFKVVVVDLGNVRSRRGLDVAVRRATRGRDFYGGMRLLQRQAMRRRLAVVFRDFDGCLGLPCEDSVTYRIVMEVRHHCPTPLVVFTARSADFVARCCDRYNSFREYVRIVPCSSDTPPGGCAPLGGRPLRGLQ